VISESAMSNFKPGVTVVAVVACSGLGADGIVDLAEGQKGCLLAVDGETGRVELRLEGKPVVFIDLKHLRTGKGRPRHIGPVLEAPESTEDASEAAPE